MDSNRKKVALIKLIKRKLFANFWIKVGSLLVAIIIWVSVSTQGRADKTFINIPYDLENIPLNLEVVDRGIGVLQITVRGPQNLIPLLSPENISIPLELPDDISAGIVTLNVKPENIRTPYQNQISILQVTPETISITLENTISKTVLIQPFITGSPAQGYELGQRAVTPERADVQGPESVITDLDHVITEPIDITGATMTFNDRVDVKSSNKLVRIVKPKRVTVRLEIKEKIIERSFPEFVIKALLPKPDPGIVLQPEVISLTVVGTQRAVSALNSQQLQLVVDCRLLAPGKHLIPLKMSQLPPGISSFSADPDSIEVIVPEMEPTPGSTETEKPEDISGSNKEKK